MTMHRIVLAMASLAAPLVFFAPAQLARADIFQWQYINPANPSQGRQPSTILCPDGAGVNAVPAADLTNRNLTKAYLVGADLGPYYDWFSGGSQPSDLTGANLSQADLTGAHLSDAALSNVNFTAATLTNADLGGATLSGANLTGADVRGAAFYGSASITLAQLYSTASYQNHDLSGVALPGFNFAGANFAAQNLTNSSFASATLSNVNFSQAILTNTRFDGAILTGANLTGALVQGVSFVKSGAGTGVTLAQLYATASYQSHDLRGIGLSGYDLTGTNFAGQNLTGASFAGATLKNANLSGANLTGANLFDALMSGANFMGAEVRGANFAAYHGDTANKLSVAQLYSTASYQAHDLTGIGLAENELDGVNLAGQNLTSADFSVATLKNADFHQAVLTHAYFLQANLTGANLSQTNLAGLVFNTATLSGANLSQTDLTNAQFLRVPLTNANLTGAQVRGANFYRDSDGAGNYGSGLTPAQLQSTASYQAHDLSGIVLAGSNLAGANLVGQNLTNATFYDYFDGYQDYYSAAILTGANLSQANLTNARFGASYGNGADLTNANLSQANLTNADFDRTTLTGASLTGAEVRGANFGGLSGSGLTAAQLSSTASYQLHDLSGIGLEGNNLVGINLADQNLANANLNGARLNNANLSRAILRNASLGYATLTGANLIGAEVRGASFSRDSYAGSGTGLSPAQLYSTASYQTHDLTGISLGDFPGIDLGGQNLTNANLSGAFAGVNLSQANLTNAKLGVVHTVLDLTSANLSQANLSGATFKSVNLTNANLNQANLTNTSFAAYYDDYGYFYPAADLTGANLSGAEVRGANFSQYYAATNGVTLLQLYSTASYQAHDLTGIRLQGNDLTGANLAGQNLTNADFSGDGYYVNGADLSGANLSGADARGANFQNATLTGANTSNLIYPDGHMAGLDLAPGASLVVRDYAGDPSRGLGPIPVIVQDHVTMGDGSAITVSGATLRFALTTGSPTIGTGVSAVVSSGATLELAGSVSALANGPNRVNVTNNSTAPGILVSGTKQHVGNIDGSGVTQVNAGSDLTANHIIQSALVIGGTAGTHAFVTIDASDALGNPLGQSKGLVLADSLAPSDPIGAGGISLAGLSSGGDSELASSSPISSVGSGNPLSVPEPSTLLLVLLAITGLAGRGIALRRCAPWKGRVMKFTSLLALLVAPLLCITSAQRAAGDIFGSGANTFDIEFVSIGHPGNTADITGDPNPAGSVAYAYRMGKFEISEQMINKANALGSLGIAIDTRGPDKPATSVTWFEAAKFVNWLNTSTGSTPAYKFDAGGFTWWQPADAGYNPANLYRNSLAKYFLPSVDEWYKAAYYDPNANGGAGGYWRFPTGSDIDPTAVASGTAAGTAVYSQAFAQGPADIIQAGGLSPFGTMAQGGNVFEWDESNVSSFFGRGVRGGDWVSGSFLGDLSSSNWYPEDPSTESEVIGFRVASIPEPSSILLAALGAMGLWCLRQRPGHSRRQTG